MRAARGVPGRAAVLRLVLVALALAAAVQSVRYDAQANLWALFNQGLDAGVWPAVAAPAEPALAPPAGGAPGGSRVWMELLLLDAPRAPELTVWAGGRRLGAFLQPTLLLEPPAGAALELRLAARAARSLRVVVTRTSPGLLRPATGTTVRLRPGESLRLDVVVGEWPR
ncbi:MAG: hypothetical protein IRZ26_00435 [Clostridia bacterium]|nr:hypothetical protein [Clostridia bacterium]